MKYRILILENDNNPAKVIDDLISPRWDDIPEIIIGAGYQDKSFTIYEPEYLHNSWTWKEVGTYKLQG